MSSKLLLTSNTAQSVIDAIQTREMKVTASFDLGISTSTIELEYDAWDVEKLRKIVDDKDTIYFWEDGEFFKAAIRDSQFYKLHPTGIGQAPALIIDGVLMHRIKTMSPIEDAKQKADTCARENFDMLEICTGLGYSTISCLDRQIRSITTIERNTNVLELARLNPWSNRLFTDERVTIVESDAAVYIKNLTDETYDAILHDPPRFPIGSELYTREFYVQLFRVLKSGGLLYHYVGIPGKKYRKIDQQKGIMNRLREVGFRKVKRDTRTEGVLSVKP